MRRRTDGLNPLWARSPLLMLRYPGLMASLTAGALLLVLAASAYPLFMAAASGAALARQLREVTLFGAGVSVGEVAPFGVRAPAHNGRRELLYERRTRVFETRLASNPHLGEAVFTLVGPTVSVVPDGAPARRRDVRLLAKTGALQHVEVVRGSEGDGAWIADTVASSLRVSPGDRLALSAVGSRAARSVRVDGVYRALYNEPRDPYWRSLSREIYPSGDSGAPPPFMLVDVGQLIELSKSLGERSGFFRWEAPLGGRPISLTQAQDLLEEIRAKGDRLEDPSTPLARAFGCTDCFGRQPGLDSLLSLAISDARRRVGALEGPVQLLFSAGMIVAVTVIAAAGAFAVATRRVEAALLFARGMSPLTVGVKACLEFLLPGLLGSLAGLGAALAVVGALGPDGPMDGAAMASAVRSAVLAVPLSMLLLGVVAAFSYLRQSETATKRLAFVAALPWELAIFLASLYLLRELLTGEALISTSSSGVSRPSMYNLLFPVLFVTGLGGMGARLLQGGLRRLRDRSAGFSHALYLVVHRLAGAPRLTLLLFTASALALGIFVYSQTMVASLQDTVDAKSKLFVGSDVQATVLLDQGAPRHFPLPITKVVRIPGAGNVSPAGAEVDLLAVDPDSLAEAAYWDEEFGAPSLQSLAAKLRFDGSGPVPIVVVGDAAASATTLELPEGSAPVDVEATVSAFPGMSSKRPLVVVDAGALRRVIDGSDPLDRSETSPQVWVKGEPGAAVDALLSLKRRPYYIVTAEQVKDIPSIAAVVETFGVLKILGLLAGLLVVVVMLMYLQARQRARVVSYALSRRMGLSDSSHRASLILELAGMLVSSFVVGVIVSLLAARVVVDRVDPLATIPPDPLFRPATLLIATLFAALCLVSVFGGYLANRRAERTDFAEVMRLAA